MPTLTFNATVKLHGTNAGVRIDDDFNVVAQSRQNDLSLEKDNAGFAAYVDYNKKYFTGFRIALDALFPNEDGNDLVIYGEWCGKGIQKDIAISQLEKMFVVFAACYIDADGERQWIDDATLNIIEQPHIRMFNILNYQTWDIDIDFNNPQDIQNELIRITEEVEKCCPVGFAYGVIGIGEGIVLTCNTDKGRFQFKSKGEKHSASKVKKLNEVDVEKMNSIKEFVDYTVTENRLKQAADVALGRDDFSDGMVVRVCDFDRKNLGKFIKAVSSDVLKEELDTLVNSGLGMKDVGSLLSKKARNWFFEQELL